MKIFVILLLTSCLALSCSTKNFSTGKYVLKHADYGKFSSSIDLKHDSTFIKNFRGEFMNDNSYGVWTVKRDTLHLYFDTLTNTHSRYRHTEHYLVDGKKLRHTISWEQIRKIKEWSAWDSLSDNQQKKLLKVLGEQNTMINFRGTMRKNFYVKVK